MLFFFKLLVENSTPSTEPDLNQQPKHYCQILLSHYSPPLYQLSYQWNLSYDYAGTGLKFLPYKIFYFFKYLAENSTASTELDMNQRPKDDCQILISHYSPPIYQLRYQWNLIYEHRITEMKLLPYKICYFSKNCSASTELDLNQRRKDYCQILISHYRPPLYQRRYQSNLIVEMTLLPDRICYFSEFSLGKSTACMYTDWNRRPKDYCQILTSRYSPPL